ncbi:MAG: FHA domain-containing protein [Myxococcales bacterium]|nr:FHA domain-containing protein [Myxococcales bacterium]
MGTLSCDDDGEGPVALLPRTLVGRSAASDLRLTDASVSAEHAVIAWSDGRWTVRDLGSRNGTRLGGRQLLPGSATPLPPDTPLCFGLSARTWVLVDAAPPTACAVQLATGALVEADGQLLALPDAEHPTATVVQRHDGAWVLEADGGERVVGHGERIELLGAVWELRLPAALPATAAGTASLDSVTLRFTVSSDEEHARWEARSPLGVIDLGGRVHTYLLATLGRARLEDLEAGVGQDSRGWRYADELARGLAITPEVLKVYVYRARQQLQAAGILGAAAVVERRASTNQIRMGIDAIEVCRG